MAIRVEIYSPTISRSPYLAVAVDEATGAVLAVKPAATYKGAEEMVSAAFKAARIAQAFGLKVE